MIGGACQLHGVAAPIEAWYRYSKRPPWQRRELSRYTNDDRYQKWPKCALRDRLFEEEIFLESLLALGKLEH